MRDWCSGNMSSFQVGVTGSNPVSRSQMLKLYTVRSHKNVRILCLLFEIMCNKNAGVVELVVTSALGADVRKDVSVRVRPSVQQIGPLV